VCKAIWICLEDECIGQQSKKRWLEIAEGFLKNSDFPNYIGATDGKHVRVVKPKHSGSLLQHWSTKFHFFFVPRGKISNPDSTFNTEFKHVSSFYPSPTVFL
jgi:hypothetical protein